LLHRILQRFSRLEPSVGRTNQSGYDVDRNAADVFERTTFENREAFTPPSMSPQ
jgi:hypothetical protein